MPLSKIHELQAEHNYSFLKFFRKESKYRDWQVTVAFYTAVHLVDFELTNRYQDWRVKRLQSTDKEEDMHVWRETCVRNYYSDIYPSYKLLHERSKTSRYLEQTSGDKIASEVFEEKDIKNLLDVHLIKIIKRFGCQWV